MASAWLETLKSAEKTCLVQDGRRKVHYTFRDDSEMVEEYDTRNNELVVRKWKKKGTFGGPAERWEYEVGEQMVPTSVETESLVVSSSNPIFVRKDTKKSFQWRIRNLPYPLETYDVSVNSDDRSITIRTSNKKYYKKFTIPDLNRLNLPLEQKQIKVAHANNTLIVTYEKPAEMMEMERQVQDELKKMKAEKDGDVQCNQS
ncbi:hypothetical protein NP493_1810g00004 [Ridgeia piscesae]|uniref:Protein DPCD n=1 Tax=Ridgeia piscesae TaxID=27915 RepID=A0AAD9JSA5_RIDPI|nr:hypothetical protein NP493_1810g00004 [Ridgeia piscesae]